MTTLEILFGARELISDPEHWTTETLARDCNGDPTYYKYDDAVKFCAVGAICRVNFKFGHVSSNANNSIIELNSAIDSPGRLDAFNDTHTHTEVLSAFDRAIKSLRRAEGPTNA